jgi:micrococcal nuclease
MRENIIKLGFFVLVLSFILPLGVSAHSGRTDENGCHTNRKTGGYHCHSSSSAAKIKEARTESRSPANIQAKSDAPNSIKKSETNCNIKGNISSSGEKIYHLVGCLSYSQTKIDEAKGERWFCTEEEATAKGWRKAKNCP